MHNLYYVSPLFFFSVYFIFSVTYCGLILNLLWFLKIASLLKIPFLDEEVPNNSLPRKV